MPELLTKLYQARCSERSDISEHLATFVALVVELDAKKVIELGVRSGVSTAAWLYGVEQTDGHLWSVDVDPAPVIPSNRWTFVRGNDTEPDVVDQLPESVDIVFIDTSHTYEHTLEELATYTPHRVRSGGRIVCHDTEVANPDNTRDYDYPVKRAIDLFCMANGYSWSNQTNCYGLGIIEIR